MAEVIIGVNDLTTTHPKIAKLWHPTKNEDLKPYNYTATSSKRVWWFLPYDDPNTGKHFDFEWFVPIAHCVSSSGCPYLAKFNPSVWKGFNDLETNYPELAKEWHPTKNGSLKPEDVVFGSGKKVWWYLPYNDPITGKTFYFEWEMHIWKRTKKNAKCPFIYGHAVWPGFNDLETREPEIAKLWHPTKNDDLMPSEVIYNSSKHVWWYLPYDDPKTGKHFDFEWYVPVNRCVKSKGCPYLAPSKPSVWLGFNDLESNYPELAKEWHPTKNGALKPTDVTTGSEKKVWWFLPYDDPKTGKHFDFEWEMHINRRTNKGFGCPFLSGHAVWPGFNDLESNYPELAKEWHPTKNGALKPIDVTAGIRTKVWWYLPYDDLETGKHFDFEWEASIMGRTQGNGCPFISGRAVWPGFNDLETIFPDVAKEWHPYKNGTLLPKDVTAKSEKEVWWLHPYDDPKTGKHFDFEWKTQVAFRIQESECPYIRNRLVWRGYNDLATSNPELVKEWHPIKNGSITPYNITNGYGKSVWWYLPYDDPKTGKHFDFEWKTTILHRIEGNGCPYLSGQAVMKGFNDLATTNPELAAQWHPTKNGKVTPFNITAKTTKKFFWYLPYDDPKTGKHFDFEWKAAINNRTRGNGCPYLSNQLVWVGYNDLATTNPELIKEWDFEKNKDIKPTDVTAGANKKVWWKLDYYDSISERVYVFKWKAYISQRSQGAGCPQLSQSSGEQAINKYLHARGIPFIYQKKFKELMGTGSRELSYDFAIAHDTVGWILIEYQGMQHYKSINLWGGDEQFERQKEHDKRKRIFAKESGFALIEVKYTFSTYQSIADYLDNKLEELLPLADISAVQL